MVGHKYIKMEWRTLDNATVEVVISLQITKYVAKSQTIINFFVNLCLATCSTAAATYE